MVTIRETTEVDHGLYGASAQVISSAILTLKTPKRALNCPSLCGQYKNTPM